MALSFVKLGLAHCGRGPLQEKLGKMALTLGLQTGDYDTAYHALVHMPSRCASACMAAYPALFVLTPLPALSGTQHGRGAE